MSYPYLWLLNQTYWFHWDGNTNTLIERNVASPSGQGAAFDRDKFNSTVVPKNLHQLEITIRKLTPPVWPAPLLGPIDGAKAARGKTLYQNHCINCHRVAVPAGHDVLDALYKAQEWGRQPVQQARPHPPSPNRSSSSSRSVRSAPTPLRAMNFATNVSRRALSSRAGPTLPWPSGRQHGITPINPTSIKASPKRSNRSMTGPAS